MMNGARQSDAVPKSIFDILPAPCGSRIILVFRGPRSLKLRLQIFRKMNPTLRPSKVVETGVYVKDLERAQRFYGDVLSLELYTRQEGRHVFFKAGKSMLLLFNADTTLKEKKTPNGA